MAQEVPIHKQAVEEIDWSCMSNFTEIDRLNLQDIAIKNLGCAIEFSSCFLDGSEKHAFGFIPNDWNGTTLKFEYADRIS